MENSLLSHVLFSAKDYLNNLSKPQNVYVVIGNETCDLDSAVSSLVFSLLLHHLKSSPSTIVIPVFNIPRLHLPIKTEVTYLLTKYNIAFDSIICRDEINLDKLQKKGLLRLVLVDHHVLLENNLKPSVVAVVDHRPPDPAWPWSGVDFTLNVVGSCCTLIAEKLLSQSPQLLSPIIATWLLGAILLDTACLAPSAGRATALDIQISAQLEHYCPNTLDREQLYKELLLAKTNITSLTASQLLIKDLKIASGIPIAGLPINVKEFLKRNDAVDAVKQFCAERKVEVCVIYGQSVSQGELIRDLAVFGSESASKVVSALLDSRDPWLNLQPESSPLLEFSLFRQLNIKASRKQILPIIQQVATTL